MLTFRLQGMEAAYIYTLPRIHPESNRILMNKDLPKKLVKPAIRKYLNKNFVGQYQSIDAESLGA